MAAKSELLCQFEEDTAYEALVLGSLSRARELELGRTTEARDDIRGATKHFAIGVAEHLGGSAVRAALEPFRPLVFGASYKVLDLAVELTMVLSEASKGSWRWTFTDKQAYATSRAAPRLLAAPLDTSPELWDRFASLYDTWLEARHAVVHSRVEQGASGDLQPYNRDARPLAPITADDAEAFALAVYGLREAIVAAAADERRLNAIAWHLDALRHIHGLPSLEAIRPASVARRIVDDLKAVDSSRWRIDVKRIAAHIESQDGVRFADLELHAEQDGEHAIFHARFEQLPAGDAVEFDERELPEWLSRVS
jgi:hypothetical protein